MASRRKRAKPTNKARHIPVEDELNDESDIIEVVPKEIGCLSTSQKMSYNSTENVRITKQDVLFTGLQVNNITTMQDCKPAVNNPLTSSSVKQHNIIMSLPPCEVSEPMLALPPDVMNDFEALRSATKLDSSALMRRLLRLADTTSRERKLDDVIEGIRGRSGNITEQTTPMTAAVLDLSIPDKNTEMNVSQQSHSPKYDDTATDDRFTDTDPDSPARPLDLTLHKQDDPQPVSSQGLGQPEEYIRQGNETETATSSLFTNGFQSSTTSPSPTPCSHAHTEMKQAAAYVINLESPTATIHISPPFNPIDKLERGNEPRLSIYDPNSLTSSPAQPIHLESLPHSHPQKYELLTQKPSFETVVTKATNITQSPVVIQHRQGDSSTSSYPPSALFPTPSTSLPSYTEAVNSVFHIRQTTNNNSNNNNNNNNSKHNSNQICNRNENGEDVDSNTNDNNNINNNNNNNRIMASKLISAESTNQLINSEGKPFSVLQIRPDFSTSKSIQPHLVVTPENFLIDASEQKEIHHEGIYSTPNFLITTEPNPLLSNKTAKFLPSPTFTTEYLRRNEHLSKLHLPQTNVMPGTVSPPSSSPARAVGIDHMTLRTSNTLTTQAFSHVSMPLSTVYMSQTRDGSLGNVVAIPIFRGLSEGFPDLQHITFESATSSPAEKELKASSTTLSIEPVNALATTKTYDHSILQHLCSMPVPSTSANMTASVNTSQVYMNSIASESNNGGLKMRPGRPKGRTGKTTKKTQNKSMKLLTENSLFPGVYTSILKLPWSKRTRNKSKAKTDAGITKHRDKVVENTTMEKAIDLNHEAGMVHSSNNVTHSELAQNVEYRNNETPMDQPLMTKEEMLFPTAMEQMEQNNQDVGHQRRLRYLCQTVVKDEQRTQNDGDESGNIQQISCTPSPSCIATSLDNTDAALTIKTELNDTRHLQSEIRHNVMLSSASIAANHDQHISNCQDPIMLIYPNIGPNGSKTRKRRGRPPKKPMLDSKGNQESFLFPVDSVFYSPDSIPDVSFLHSNNPNLTLIPAVSSSSLNQDLSLMSPPSLSSTLPSLEKAGDTDLISATTCTSSGFPNVGSNEDVTLENKIIFLTNQIEREMAQGPRQHPREQTHINVNLNETNHTDQTDTPVQIDGSYTQVVTKSPEKQTTGVKQRRKKTSRMLKSNENFMYTTFRFKPRGGGSGAKKVKKKRRNNNCTSPAANAETMSNLRNKKLKCTERDQDNTRSDSGIQAWKFHEQYPCSVGVTNNNNNQTSISTYAPCVACGKPVVHKSDDFIHTEQLCLSCLNQHEDNESNHDKEMSSDENPTYETNSDTKDTFNNNVMVGERDIRLILATCISCGNKFEKQSPDPTSQCDTCRRNIQSFIRSSKLFSIPNPINDRSSTPPAISLIPVTQCDQIISNNRETVSVIPNQISSVSNDGVLFCGLCRMQFTRISEYLLHLKETHEPSNHLKCGSQLQSTQLESLKISTDSPCTPNRMKSTLKTKKSLSHKTLTCPIEDCPLFFRHKRDMDHHLRKVHQQIDFSPDTNIGIGQKEITSLQGGHMSNILHGNETLYASVEELSSPNNFDPSSNVDSLSQNCSDQSDSAASDPTLSEKPLRCMFCSFRCRQKNAMAWHIRKHPEAASQHRRYSNVNTE